MTDLRDKPVWQLTSAEIDQLDPQERQWVVSQVGYLKESGALAVISANPVGTTYETAWCAGLGWKLQPICNCPAFVERQFVDAYLALPSTQSGSAAE